MQKYQISRLFVFFIIFLFGFGLSAHAQDVNSMGAFTYSYPIDIPQGRNGFAPSVSIEYNSNGSNGFLGAGFSIGGLSVITRDRTHGISFDDTIDYFLLDGQRLYKDAGGKYHPEKENFNRIELVYPNTADSYWLVTLKNGTKMYYGYRLAPDNDSTSDGRIEAMAMPGKTLLWCLDWVEDTLGNYYLIKYDEDPVNGDYYPSQIAYRKNRYTQPAKLVYVDFAYETRTDVIPTYVPTLVQIDKRLIAITVKADTTLIRKYKVNYEYEASIGMSRIVSLEEFGSDAAEASPTPLPATRFEWQQGADDWSGALTANNVFPDSGASRMADINADGLADWVPYGGVNYNLGTSVGFGERITNYGPYVPGPGWINDINGDAIPDIIAYTYGTGTGYVYYNLGSINTTTGALSYGSVNVQRKLTSGEKQWFNDLNNDGLMDLALSTSGKSYYMLGQNEGGNFCFTPLMQISDGFYCFAFADINGDSLIDYTRMPSGGYLSYYLGKIDSNGIFTYNNTLMKASGFSDQYLYYCDLMDLNGDKIADWVYFNDTVGTGDTTLNWKISTGNGFSATQAATIWANRGTFWFLDINNDGYQDYLTKGGDSILYWNLGTGNGFGPKKSFTFPDYVPGNPFFADKNGDGLLDFIVKPTDYGNRNIYWYTLSSSPSTKGNPTLITKITTSQGGEIRVGYKGAAQKPGTISHTLDAYPVMASASPLSVVDYIEMDGKVSANGPVVRTNYDYFAHMAKMGKPWERDDLGFRWTKATDANTGTYTKTWYRQDWPYDHLVEKVEICDSGNNKYRETVNSYDAIDAVVSGSKFVYKTQEDANIYDGQATCDTYRTRYTEYDQYGNLTEVLNDGDLSVEKDESAVTTEYAIDTSNWVFMPSSVIKSGYNLDDVWCDAYAREDFFYDDNESLGLISKGKLTKKRTWVNEADPDHPVDARFGYDSTFGFLEWTQDGKMAGGSENTKEYEYDTEYQMLLTKERSVKLIDGGSPVYFETTTNYDQYLRPYETIDVNNAHWKREYDVYGRITKTIDPGDDQNNPATQTIFSDTVFPRQVQSKVKIQNGTFADAYQYFDGLGRIIQEKKLAEIDGSNGYITTDYFYDASGRNWKTSIPYKTTALARSNPDTTQKFTKHEFDPINRVKKTTSPDTTYTQTVYNKKLTYFINKSILVCTKEIDGNKVIDKTYTIEEPYPYTNPYSTTTRKSAWNGTKITDTNGNILRTTLDSAGRKIRYEDPDMGTWTYEYDDNGNLVSQTDNKTQTIVFTYDSLNRITRKHYPAGDDIVYAYDENDHGSSKGRLTTVTYPAGSDSYTYDDKGHVTIHKKTLYGNLKQLSYEYYSNNTVKRITYPDGEVVEYGLDSGAQINTVTGASSYVTSVNYTELNKVSSIAYGNGVSTAYDYYDKSNETDGIAGTTFSYRLRGMTLSTPGYLNMSYQYDKAGNIRIKTDANNANRTENYVYDEFYRLITASAADPVYGTRNYAYNEINNIVTKEGHTYTYGSTAPHAVTNDGTNNYYYDDNGNLQTRVGGDGTQTFYSFDYDNRLCSVTTSGSTDAYWYDAGNARVKKLEGSKTTYYYFPEYEEEYTDAVLSKTTKYYFMNGQRIAERSSLPEEGLRYYHTDHLGSSVRMTNAAGALVRAIGYLPFGGTWYSDGVTKYQYTGKEKDASGLYFYGARYYDPELARFISPDPILDGLNRYTYCRNNPINYNDPSGMETTNAPDVSNIGQFVEEQKKKSDDESNTTSVNGKDGKDSDKDTPVAIEAPSSLGLLFDPLNPLILAALENKGGKTKAERFKEGFLDAINKKVGSPYILGGGSCNKYGKLDNKDKNGKWLGYDCSGGINTALGEGTGLAFKARGANALSTAPFVDAIGDKDLQAGDLIFINNPSGGIDENGNIVYGGIDHIMTYIGEGKIITTDGNVEPGKSCDVRINPASQVETKMTNMKSFYNANQNAFPGARWTYGRINWAQLAE